MSYATFAILNPLRFRNESVNIDNASILPNPDNAGLGYMSFDGDIINNYAEPVLINKDFIFQIETQNSTAELTVTLLDEDKNSLGTGFFTIEDVTPTSWTGDDVFNIVLNYGVVRCAYVRIAINGGQTYISDLIEFVSTLKHHVEIRYSNHENDFGMVLFDDPLQYIFTTHVPGSWINNVKTEKESNVYDDDRGHSVVLRSTPKRIFEVIFPHIPANVIERLTMIFACSETSINGYRMVATGSITAQQATPSTNHHSLSVDLEVFDWNYKHIFQTGIGFPYTFPYQLS